MSIELENAIEVLTDELRGMKNARSGEDYWRRAFVAAALPGFAGYCLSRIKHIPARFSEEETEAELNRQISRLAINLADAVLAGLEWRK